MHFDDLKREVIDRGLCHSCGTCAGICPTGGVEMQYVDHEPEPVLIGKCDDACSLCYDTCSGQDIPMSALDRMVFGRERKPEKELLGINRKIMAAHAADPQIRAVASYGGAATALLVYALEQGLIEAAMVAQMSPKEPWHGMPVLATNRKEIIAAAQFKYQLVPTNALLGAVMKGKYKRIGHVGLGCQTEAMRKLQLLYPKHRINKTMALSIGIACNNNYYSRATELLLLERCGVRSLDEVARVEYGNKAAGGFKVTRKNGGVFSLTRQELYKGFLSRYFLRERCTMCTDVTNELADLSVSERFAPEIPGEGKRLDWSSVIIRTEKGEEIVKDAEAKGYLVTHTHPADSRFLVLNAGLYEKKHSAAYKIMKRKRYDWAVPDWHYPPIIEPLVPDIPLDPTSWHT